MKSNEVLREEIFTIIKNQIRMNKPPETNQTLKRLKEMGYNDMDARKLIGQCIALELYNILKYKKPFDESRYLANLSKLPEEPREH